MDRLGFWGAPEPEMGLGALEFQYPLMDRLGFWGRCYLRCTPTKAYFSIR